ncbi:hypothetical protein GQ54DRAFT_309451 [Martensiomyces pterosporus]|nr:hypothetical protein GQ54DRAFT_309451 [Martensiomyces pterosporus]
MLPQMLTSRSLSLRSAYTHTRFVFASKHHSMADRFENRARGMAQQVYNAADEQSKDLVSRSKYSSILVGELDTQVQELKAATRALGVARRNCCFDIGIRKC